MRLPLPLLLALLSALVPGCSRTEAPPPDLDLRPGRGATVERLLDRVSSAQLRLAQGNLPPDAEAPTHHTLDTGWRQASWGEGQVWQHPSPVRLTQKRHSRQPAGLTLRAGDRELPFDPAMIQESRVPQHWLLWRDELFVVSRQSPSRWPAPPVLSLSPAAEREAELNLATSGLAPVDFAQREVSIGKLTLPCLYLPAPSSAELPLAVPAEGGTLRWSVGMADSGDETEVAQARLVVRLDGVEVASTTTRTGQAWQEQTLDLGRWAGATPLLTLETDPLGDPLRDYLCVGSPVLEHPAPAQPDPVRIVVVGLDTLRTDHLGFAGYGRDTSPALDAFARQSFVFERTWGPAPRTRPSFRTAVTGRWPLRAIGAPTLGEVLRPAGLVTGGIVANVHLAPRLGFSRGFDSWRYDNGARADEQVDQALAWLGQHRSQDALLFLHLMDPHTFYLAPEPWTDRYTGGIAREGVPDQYNRWTVAEWMEKDQLGPGGKEFIKARYDGEIAYMDQALGRLFQGIDALPGRSLVVVLTDHGEELWDHGGFEHNHTLYDELTRTLLWVRPPGGLSGGPARMGGLASLADLVPTLAEAVGVPTPEVDGTSLWPLLDPGRSADRLALEARLQARALPLGHLMFDTERWGVVALDPAGRLHKYLLHTASGREELYDLDADPGEQADRSGTTDLGPWRQALSRATEWPVGEGGRLELSDLSAPARLRFAAPVEAAAVMDPEADTPRRANLEWGELPPLRPRDVAAVELSADRLELSITPGAVPRGVVLVVGGGGPPEVVEGPEDALRWAPGAVIVPLESEAQALGLEGFGGEADETQLEALRQLGYLE